MLPYSPLHHLLLADAATPLVMTSGNRLRRADRLPRRRCARSACASRRSAPPSRPPDPDANRRLGRAGPRPRRTLANVRAAPLARVRAREPAAPRRHPRAAARLRRRAEEHVLPGQGAACVGRPSRRRPRELRNAALVRRRESSTSKRLFAVEPQIVAHDLHPEYLSTKYALERDGVELVGVQHHHAHLAACLAEHGEGGVAVGAIFDGTGYGADGTVWGGEFLCGDLADFRRVGMLAPVALPGGARAIREPWRMACAWLGAVLGMRLRSRPTSATWSTSAGGVRCRRSFAAVSTLRSPRAWADCSTPPPPCAECVPRVNYEGQAAIELEAACDSAERGCYPIDLVERRGGAPARSSRDDPGARRRRSRRRRRWG